nr:ATP-dependent DNA helicase PIF1-like [Tanacetum cinerariifolium]
MTKVIKGEFEKLESVKIIDVLLTFNTSLEIFNEEFNRMSRMEDDLFTYEVEIAEVTNIPCDLKKKDDSKQQISHESNNDMEYDPSDVEFTECLDSKFFNYKTMDHYTMKALWTYWAKVDDEVELTEKNPLILMMKMKLLNIDRFKTYEEYKDDWIYEWNKDVPLLHERPWRRMDWKDDGYCNGGNLPGTYIIRNTLRYQDLELYEALKDGKLKEEALKNKAIMDGMINEDDKSSNEDGKDGTTLTIPTVIMKKVRMRWNMKMKKDLKKPEREFRSSSKLLKTLSLDESRSREFNFIFDLEEYSDEEVAETMEQLDVQTRQILDLKGAIPSKIVADANVTIQEMAEYSQKWHNGTSKTRSTETSDGLAAIQAQLNNFGREIKKKLQIGQISKVLQERVFESLPSSTEANLRDHVKSISTTAEADSNLIRRIGSPQYAVSTPQNRRFMFESRQTTIPFSRHLNDYYCEEKKGSYRPQFSKAYSYEVSHIDKSIPRKEKDPRSFTLPCYINIDCFDNALADLGAKVSVMPFLTYLNLGSGELSHTKLTVELANMTVKYPKGIANNVLAVENMDGYRDRGIGDIILEEPFFKASCVEAKRFDGLITIYNGSDNVTYQMKRSHPRFKHLSNTQCNKIKPLLKVTKDEGNDGVEGSKQKSSNFGYQKSPTVGSSSCRKDKGVANASNITMIKDVDPMLDNIISLWHSHRLNEAHNPYSLDMVLQDSQDVVNATINSSYLWEKCTVLRLTVNMRLGIGKVGGANDGESTIVFPDNMLIPEIDDDVGDENEYESSDSVCLADEDSNFDDSIYTTEFLNGLRMSGIPNHNIKLKIGTPIMLMCNINQRAGLCNETRLQVLRLGINIIEAQIISDGSIGTICAIPRMVISPTDTKMPFKLNRRQFPIQVCFAMTINKAKDRLCH